MADKYKGISDSDIVLRYLKLEDAKELSIIGNERFISRFNWHVKYPLSVAGARRMILEGNALRAGKRKIHSFGITLKKGGRLIGVIDIYDVNLRSRRASLGYWIGGGFRLRGYASRSISIAISFAFKRLKLNKLKAESLVHNATSNHLLSKFVFNG